MGTTLLAQCECGFAHRVGIGAGFGDDAQEYPALCRHCSAMVSLPDAPLPRFVFNGQFASGGVEWVENMSALHGLAAAHANCPECGRERSDPAPPATIPP